jgi:hypothetical protein
LLANDHQPILRELRISDASSRRSPEIVPRCNSDQKMAKESPGGTLSGSQEQLATFWMNPVFLVGPRRKRAL